MREFTEYEVAQLTNQSECYIHTHPRDDNFTFPHGGFSDSTDQTASANTPTVMKLNTTDINDGVDVVSLTKITVPRTGVYNLQFSAQFTNTVNATPYEVVIWFRVDGVDVPNSSTQLTVPGKHSGDNGHAVAAWNLFLRLTQGSYAEIVWSTASGSVFIEHMTARSSPFTCPAVPSVIATMTFVSDR
jgi:hypothetical protein